MRFQDRQEAGRQLADRLQHYRNANPLVLAIPRGGVVVGYVVAQALNAPLDVLVVRKLGAPGNPELGIGAIGPGGICILDRASIDYLGISESELEREIATQRAELERRIRRFRGDRPLPEIRDRTVIVVDDGLATGVTARAALQALRQKHPRRLVLAVPVAAQETAEALRSEVEELVCVVVPPYLRAIGFWYADFAQVSDEEVLTWLERARQERSEAVVSREIGKAPAAGPGT